MSPRKENTAKRPSNNDAMPDNWATVAGPPKIRPPFHSFDVHELVDDAPAAVASHMLKFPGMRLLHEGKPTWWDWKSRWKHKRHFIALGMNIFEGFQPNTWAGFGFEANCTLDEFLALWRHLRKRFPAAWLHNDQCELHSPQSFRKHICLSCE